MMQSARKAFKMLVVLIVLTGLIYPLLITLIAHVVMPKQAGGSLIHGEDKIVGSELIAQNFKKESYFWPRPSAVDFDPVKPAGGSSLGPTSQKLKEVVKERSKKIGSHPPPELVYASGSGLDPHISLETAYFQIARVAQARSVHDRYKLHTLIDSLQEGFEHKYVNVLLLNQALDQRFPLRQP